jgi:benzoate transport
MSAVHDVLDNTLEKNSGKDVGPLKDLGALKSYMDVTNMTRYQWVIIAVCGLLYIVDGFDILVMAFTAHSISESWSLSGSQIGVLISCGLGGTAVGSFFVAPFGDRFGRRTVILVSLAIASLCMIFSACAANAFQLGCLRFLTGICIGGILTNCNVLTSEYSSIKWRSLTICLLSTGYAIGATFGGVLAMYVEKRFGWRVVFLIGGLMSLMSLLVAVAALSESLYFLINRKPRNCLRKIQSIRVKLQLPELSSIATEHPASKKIKGAYAELFKGEAGMATVLLWIALYCLMFGFYYILTWTPKVLTNSGLSNEQGISAGVVINFGAMFGTIVFGFLGTRYNIKTLQVFFLLSTAVLVVVFGFSLGNLDLALMLGLVVGIFGVGATAGLHTIAPMIYESSQRATGVGLAIGIGRLGSMSSPIVAGILLDQGWKPTSLFFLVGVVLVVSAMAVVLMKAISSSSAKN